MATTRGRQVVIPVTNKSGGALAAGDVVIVDTSNDTAVTTTTTGRAEVTIGVVQEAIANNATGRVLTHGYAALVNVPASVTRGHYVETHTVAKQATGSSTRRSGSFGQFLTGGTTPTAILWGQTDQTASGGSSLTVEEVDGSPTDSAITKIVFPNGTLGIASHVATYTPAGGSGVSGKLPVNCGSATQTSSSTTLAVTIAAAASGNILIACISGIGTANVSSISSTNTTWTLLKTSTAGTSPKAEIWVGVVAGGSSGTTVTITFSAANSDRAAVISEWNGIAGTLDQSAMRAGASPQGNWGRHSTPAILPTNANALVVGMAATTNGTIPYSAGSSQMVGFEPFLLNTGSIIGYMSAFYAFPGTVPIGVAVNGPTSGAYSAAIASVT